MSTFDWQAKPSEVAKALKPSPQARKNSRHVVSPVKNISRKADEILRERFGGSYSRATSADAAREKEIAQVNQEVERHFALAQAAPEGMKAVHRDEARRLAARVKALVEARPEAYVAHLEQQRGLA